MEFFVYGRDRPDPGPAREELGEAHWDYMDEFGDRMIARGPTLDPKRATATGSMHIVDLPGVQEARRFAFEEPYYRAGVFEFMLIRRWKSVKGKTMWEFEGDEANNRRFLILGEGRPDAAADRARLRDAHLEHLMGRYGERVIAAGPLLADDGEEWQGSAILVELPDRTAAEAMVAADPYTEGGLFARVEIHDWEFGGRR